MYWFCFAFVHLILTAASTVLLRFFLLAVRLTVKHFAEGRGGVKILLRREGWLMAGERCSNSRSNASKRGRYASIKYETAGTSGDFSGEDFQNTGTFIVARSSVFAVSSVQNTHLARDAYNAYSRKAGRCQGLYFQYQTVAGPWDEF